MNQTLRHFAEALLGPDAGYPTMPIGEVDLRRLLPAAEPGPVAGASHAHYDGQLEPARALDAHRAALQAAGARPLLGRVARVRVDDGGVRVEVGDQVLPQPRPYWPPALRRSR